MELKNKGKDFRTMRLKTNERDILDEAVEQGILNVLASYADAVPRAAAAINDYGIVVEFTTSVMKEIERKFDFDDDFE